jgi:hypothetical protein
VPVPPAELTAELTIAPEDDQAVQAGRQAAAVTGLALYSGARREVLDALSRVLAAALDAGATSVEVRLEVPRDTREHA